MVNVRNGVKRSENEHFLPPRTCKLDTELVFIVTVHFKKESLDETQTATDFVPAHQLDCQFNRPHHVLAEHRLLMGDWAALRGPYRKEYRDARFIYTPN